MAPLLFSATHKSSGKTVISLGVCAALHDDGFSVQAFKKGPDYIDPMWLSKSTRRHCYNLDYWTQSEAELKSMFAQQSLHADISVIEGNKGLHDGVATDGSNSNAALAKLLHAPVILILDTRGTIRGVAPLVLGYQQFDPAVNIAGIVLNLVGGSRHAAKLTKVIEGYTDIPILGVVQRDPELELVERYLGLMPSNEDRTAQQKIARIASLISKQVDLDQLMQLATTAVAPFVTKIEPVAGQVSNLKIAYAKDEAFGFYYADDLASFSQQGIQLLPFDTLRDHQLPAADALFLGGGFPEKRMHDLAANTSLRQAIYDAIEQGMPAYAECGGLMYLCKSITVSSTQCEMVGVIDAHCEMLEKPVGRGYTLLQKNKHHPWPNMGNQPIPGHEFHYSRLTQIGADTRFAYEVNRGYGVNGQKDGIHYKNLLACYSHQRNTRQNQWISSFIEFIKTCG